MKKKNRVYRNKLTASNEEHGEHQTLANHLSLGLFEKTPSVIFFALISKHLRKSDVPAPRQNLREQIGRCLTPR